MMIESLARYCVPVALTMLACCQAESVPKSVPTQPQALEASPTFDAAPASPATQKTLTVSPSDVQFDAATPKPPAVVATCKAARLCTRRAIARFLLANAGGATIVGCSDLVETSGPPTVSQALKELKGAPKSWGKCISKPSNPEILNCRLQYGGPANDTHSWSGTLSFDVETEGPTVVSEVDCEILG